MSVSDRGPLVSFIEDFEPGSCRADRNSNYGTPQHIVSTASDFVHQAASESVIGGGGGILDADDYASRSTYDPLDSR